MLLISRDEAQQQLLNAGKGIWVFRCTINFLLGKDEMPIPQLVSIEEWKVVFEQMSFQDLLSVH